jgi:MFS transporter, DHA1 family, multidrug resistance protein
MPWILDIRVTVYPTSAFKRTVRLDLPHHQPLEPPVELHPEVMDNLDLDLEAAETQASRDLSRHLTLTSSLTSQTESHTYDIARHATQIESLRSAHLQHVHTVGSTRTEGRESKPLPPFGAGKPFPPVIPAEREAYVVDFEGPTDPLHPMNWSFKTK